ncbi:hypothetical protein BC826DRAFT_177325 [Russula brevipes]|nr:hypothetical protein BC826DRAFT_177325 [Russula brevipes]
MVLFASTLIAVLATLGIVPVFAQSLSSQCQSTLASIATSSNAQCLNGAGLVPIFLSGSDNSAVPSIDTWLTGMCSKSACSNQTLLTNVTNGCSSDLSSLGLDVQNVTTSVQRFYPTMRQILCLHDSSTNQLCAVEGLYDIQNKTGTLGINKISAIVPQLISGGLPVFGLPQNAACNNCTKEAYNIILSNDRQVITSKVNSSLSNQCGANFLDGKTPAGVTQTAVGNSLPNLSGQSNKNGALGSLAVWDGLASLTGLGVVLTVLL